MAPNLMTSAEVRCALEDSDRIKQGLPLPPPPKLRQKVSRFFTRGATRLAPPPFAAIPSTSASKNLQHPTTPTLQRSETGVIGPFQYHLFRSPLDSPPNRQHGEIGEVDLRGRFEPRKRVASVGSNDRYEAGQRPGSSHTDIYGVSDEEEDDKVRGTQHVPGRLHHLAVVSGGLQAGFSDPVSGSTTAINTSPSYSTPPSRDPLGQHPLPAHLDHLPSQAVTPVGLPCIDTGARWNPRMFEARDSNPFAPACRMPTLRPSDALGSGDDHHDKDKSRGGSVPSDSVFSRPDYSSSASSRTGEDLYHQFLTGTHPWVPEGNTRRALTDKEVNIAIFNRKVNSSGKLARLGEEVKLLERQARIFRQHIVKRGAGAHQRLTELAEIEDARKHNLYNITKDRGSLIERDTDMARCLLELASIEAELQEKHLDIASGQAVLATEIVVAERHVSAKRDFAKKLAQQLKATLQVEETLFQIMHYDVQTRSYINNFAQCESGLLSGLATARGKLVQNYATQVQAEYDLIAEVHNTAFDRNMATIMHFHYGSQDHTTYPDPRRESDFGSAVKAVQDAWTGHGAPPLSTASFVDLLLTSFYPLERVVQGLPTLSIGLHLDPRQLDRPRFWKTANAQERQRSIGK